MASRGLSGRSAGGVQDHLSDGSSRVNFRARWKDVRGALSKETWIWALLLGVYLLSRLINLSILPLFIDEGVYLWWGDRILHGDLLRGLGEGKPLVGWLIALALALGSDPVVAPRLVHVILGGVTLLSMGLLANRFFSLQVALIAVVLWIFLPYALFFERLATPDVALAATGMFTVYLSARLAAEDVSFLGRRRWWLAWATGMDLVATMLTKMPVGIFFVIAPFAAVAILQPPHTWRRKLLQLVVCYALPGAFLSLATIVVVARWWLGLRPLGFGLQELLMKGALGVAGASTLDIVTRNIPLLISWFGTYFTWPLTGALLVAWLTAWVGQPRILRLLALLGGLYLTLFVFASEVFFPRYVFPALPPLVVVLAGTLARGLEWLVARIHDSRYSVLPWRNQVTTSRALYGLIAAFVLALTIPFHVTILFQPDAAVLPEADRHQYVEGMGSGYGLREAAAFLDQNIPASNEMAQVVTLHVGDHERLEAYASPALRPALRQVHIVDGRSRNVAEQIDILRSWLSQAVNTYVVVGHRGTWSTVWREAFPQARLIRSFSKPGGKDAVEIYFVEVVMSAYTPPSTKMSRE